LPTTEEWGEGKGEGIPISCANSMEGAPLPSPLAPLVPRGERESSRAMVVVSTGRVLKASWHLRESQPRRVFSPTPPRDGAVQATARRRGFGVSFAGRAGRDSQTIFRRPECRASRRTGRR